MGDVLQYLSLNQRVEALVLEAQRREESGNRKQKRKFQRAHADIQGIMGKINAQTPEFNFVLPGALAKNEADLRAAVLKFQDEHVEIMALLMAHIIRLRFKDL